MAGTMLKARPAEMTAPLLSNPGKGCATFQRFNGDPLYPDERWSEAGPLEFPPRVCDVAEQYLPTTVAYCRWFWEKFEPADGSFDWSMVEGALRTARERGQTLQVRLMAHGADRQPALPDWYVKHYPTRRPGDGRYTHLQPVYDGPHFFERWGRVIAEFGKRFDGHPELESVDIAIAGPWGEGAGECSEAALAQFTDLYVRSHPRTPVLCQTDGPQFKIGIERGLGWRCDGFGDQKRSNVPEVPAHLGWNHTFDAYPQMVIRAGAADRWKTRSVTFETYSTPLDFYNKQYDVGFMIQQGLKHHLSIFMPKSTPIPRPWLEPLAQFCDRMGYRFVLRQAKWQSETTRGGVWAYEVWIENTGVAPVYKPYRPAFRLQFDRGCAVVPVAGDPRLWLPGDALVEGSVALPQDLPTGTAQVAFGLLHPTEERVAVRFASEGADRDGWLGLGAVTVVG